MAWLSKRPQISEAAKFYTLNVNKAYLIIGLGNVGKKYELTRHNIGFMSIDSFVSKNMNTAKWVANKKLDGLISISHINSAQIIALKPTTFMNLSGNAVSKVMNFYKIQLDNILVIHDELDIDFGQIRLRRGGSSAGHNGIDSVINEIGDDFNRVRIGIGPKKPTQIASESFVLNNFSEEEVKQLPSILTETDAIINEFIYSGKLTSETRNVLI